MPQPKVTSPRTRGARLRDLAEWWLPVLVWITVIYGGSTDAFSTKRTSRFTRPFLLWLKPDISEEAIEFAQLCVRKTYHAVEYGILTLLLWRARYRWRPSERRAWSREHALAAWSLALAYAVSDEFHQSFVASREGSARDIAVDAAGAFVSLVALGLAGKLLRRW